jgi:hypothetical protein
MSRDKYLFDTLEIEKKCYVLLACFAASEQIHSFCETLSDLNIPRISILEPGMVTDILIFVGVQLRMIDDIMKAHGRTHHVPDFNVGLLNEGNEQRELDVREACNKIIHARVVDVNELSASGAECLAKTIKLSGTRGGTTWNARIEVGHFIKAALFLVNRYDEDWDVSGYT